MSSCSDTPLSPGGAALVTAAAMTVLLVCPLLVFAYWKHRHKQALHKKVVMHQIVASLRTTQVLDCPAMYITAADFIKLGKLRRHEELRDEGKLIYRDTAEQLGSDNGFVAFLSHQWLSADDPDPDCVHYPVMVAAVKKLAQSLVNGEFESRFLRHTSSEGSFRAQHEAESDAVIAKVLNQMLIWVDYISIPQTPCEMQTLAIRTLPSFCTYASAFIVIAPIAKQKETGAVCNFTTYQSRMWTRAEQFSHASVCGINSMWIATSEAAIDKMSSHKLLGMGDRWVLEICHVFEGLASNDMDRLALVTPLLGMYAELYACASDIDEHALAHRTTKRERTSKERVPSKEGGKALTLERMTTLIRQRTTSTQEYDEEEETNFNLLKMMDHIFANKSSMFPATTVIDPESTIEPGYDPTEFGGQHGNTVALLGKQGPQKFELFGDFIAAMEDLIDGDEILRDELRRKGLQRRGLPAAAAEALRQKVSRSSRRSSRDSHWQTSVEFSEGAGWKALRIARGAASKLNRLNAKEKTTPTDIFATTDILSA